jgi:hypothetical protein
MQHAWLEQLFSTSFVLCMQSITTLIGGQIWLTLDFSSPMVVCLGPDDIFCEPFKPEWREYVVGFLPSKLSYFLSF